MDLGDFYYRRGDLDNALKNFVRTRDYCGAMPRHNIDMCLNVIKVGRLVSTFLFLSSCPSNSTSLHHINIHIYLQVSVDLNSYAHVNNYISKAEHTPDLNDRKALAKLKASSGLAQLHQQQYAASARKFLEVPSEFLPSTSAPTSSSTPASASSSSLSSSSGAGGEVSSTSFSHVSPISKAIYKACIASRDKPF